MLLEKYIVYDSRRNLYYYFLFERLFFLFFVRSSSSCTQPTLRSNVRFLTLILFSICKKSQDKLTVIGIYVTLSQLPNTIYHTQYSDYCRIYYVYQVMRPTLYALNEQRLKQLTPLPEISRSQQLRNVHQPTYLSSDYDGEDRHSSI